MASVGKQHTHREHIRMYGISNPLDLRLLCFPSHTTPRRIHMAVVCCHTSRPTTQYGICRRSKTMPRAPPHAAIAASLRRIAASPAPDVVVAATRRRPAASNRSFATAPTHACLPPPPPAPRGRLATHVATCEMGATRPIAARTNRPLASPAHDASRTRYTTRGTCPRLGGDTSPSAA